MAKMLDIGCGNKPKEGYIGLDHNPFVHPDILWQAEQRIPFENQSISRIWLDNSLEHFSNPKEVLEECYRVLDYDGIIEIKIPNLQWFPLLILAWFVDIHKFWDWWMRLPFKKERGIHYTLWTKFTLELLLKECKFTILETKGWFLAKQIYIKANK